LAAGVAFGLATAAQAENWYAFYIMPLGTTYVDKDSIIHRPGHVSAKLQSTFPAPQYLQKNGRLFVYTKSLDLLDIDCKARVYRYLSRDLLNDGGQPQTSIVETDNPQLIVDRSAQDVLAKGFCPKD
jgi:hypothetical protein